MSKDALAELVSQAEQEGVTLAEVIARTWSPGQMARAQAKLEKEIRSNSRNIADFMGGVVVPSLEELLALEETDRFELGASTDPLLSDAPPLE
jgi:hypothetical protein